MKTQRPHSIASTFIGNTYLLSLSIIIILVGGFSAFNGLPRLEDPIISNRNAQIATVFPGASAERVEALISEPLEQKLKEVPDIKSIESISRTGVSVVSIELADKINEDTNDAIFSEIRDKMREASNEFPQEALDPIFDDKRNAVAYTLILALSWTDGHSEHIGILQRHADYLADQIRSIGGTDLVRIFGKAKEEITVTLNSDLLALMDVTPHQVAQALMQSDAKLSAGVLRNSDSEMLLEVKGEFDSVQRISEVPISINDSGYLMKLGDLAHIENSLKDPQSEIAVRDGRRSILVAARVEPEQRVDKWIDANLKSIDSFNDQYGNGFRADIVFNQESYTAQRLNDLVFNLLLGAVVVFLVVFFTMGWRSSLIISSALPLVASLTLFIVALNGGKLHQMSIFGMIIALGLLIDNAIVMTDEVRRQLRTGLEPVQAFSAALRHLFWPLLSSTVTTILSFLPILLLPGPAGDFVSSISSSVIIALIVSFFVGMTIIGSFASLFGKSSDRKVPGFLKNGLFFGSTKSWVEKVYLWVVRYPGYAVLISLIMPVLGVSLASSLGNQFFPRTDRNMFEIEIRMPTSASLESTRIMSEKVSQIILNSKEVEHIDWLIGGSFPTVYYNLIMNQDGAKNYAHGIITSDHFDSVKKLIPELQGELDELFPEAQILLTQFAQGPPAEADVEIRFSGPDLNVLRKIGDDVRVILAEHPEILHTLTTLSGGEPKAWVEVDEVLAAQTGQTPVGIARQLGAAFEGSQSGFILEGIENMPVRIKFPQLEKDQIADVDNFRILNNSSEWVPVSALGNIDIRPTQGAITRLDGARVNKIFGFAKSGTLPVDITQSIMRSMEAQDYSLPDGYKMEIGGETENRDEAVGNLLLYLPVIVVLTIAILVLTFKSVRIAVILLSAALLSTGFGLIATWIMQFPLSFNTIIGSMGLMGLAFNSSIVVIAAIRQNPKAAKGDPVAISQAVSRTSRHLLSTTLTTMGSFLPLLIFIGGQFWPPLAIVLAGGVGGSTLLAMTFTPAMYKLLMCSPKIGQFKAIISRQVLPETLKPVFQAS